MPEFIDVEQNGEAWHAARLGIPTASMFATVLAVGPKGGSSATRKTYLHKLAGEIITGKPAENYSNGHMERGHEMEPEARSAYTFIREVDAVPVGFVRNEIAGASPDSLVGSDGLLEIKTKLPHLLIECMLRDGFPPEHKAQVQGQLWITEREWCDLAVYWPGMPLVIHRAHRDEQYITDLRIAVHAFHEELAAIVERVRNYGAAA